MELSLLQHLEDLGWGERFLDTNRKFARLGLRSGCSCLEPYSRFQRLMTRESLPINKIIPVGTRVKFLKSLKHEMLPSGSFFSAYGVKSITGKGYLGFSDIAFP